MEEITKSSSRKIIIFSVIIVLALIASLFFQKNKMEEEMELKVQFIEQKNMLRDELDDLIDEHDDLLDEYGELNEHLHDKDSVIQQKITEIRNLIRTKNNLKEARRKISSLKDISKRYLANIDSFLILNEQLTIEKDSVIKVNKNINWKNYKLNKQNEQLAEKVSKGSILELLNFNIETIRFRSTGKEVTTKYARKVQKIRICFTIGANQISDAETKLVYMQLIDPLGNIIKASDKIEVIIEDSILNATAFVEFDYMNIETVNCFEWERIQQLESGDYLINIIIEGRVVGIKQFKLK